MSKQKQALYYKIIKSFVCSSFIGPNTFILFFSKKNVPQILVFQVAEDVFLIVTTDIRRILIAKLLRLHGFYH